MLIALIRAASPRCFGSLPGVLQQTPRAPEIPCQGPSLDRDHRKTSLGVHAWHRNAQRQRSWLRAPG